MGDTTRQRALLAHVMQDDGNNEQIPPDRFLTINAYRHPGWEGGGGGAHPAAHAHVAQPGDGGRPPDTAACDPSARTQEG